MRVPHFNFVGTLAHGGQFWKKNRLGELWRRHAPSLLARAVLVATMLAVVNATAYPTGGEAPDVVFKVNGQLINLAEILHDKLSSQADKIVRSCAYDIGDQDEEVWHAALAEPSSIRLVYATPLKLRLPRREILVSQALFSLGDAKFLGQPVLHYNGRTTPVAKCDGMEMLRLMCMPDLATYFPPGYQANCHIVRQ